MPGKRAEANAHGRLAQDGACDRARRYLVDWPRYLEGSTRPCAWWTPFSLNRPGGLLWVEWKGLAKTDAMDWVFH